jgi:uncharacterized protein
VTLLAQAPANPTREADRTPIDDSSHQETIQQEPVALAAPVGTFFDYSALHILTTATLNRFKELYPAGQFEMCRFRPNLVVSPDSDERNFIENHWLGSLVTIGEETQLSIIDPCPRCVRTTLPQAGFGYVMSKLYLDEGRGQEAPGQKGGASEGFKPPVTPNH